MKYFKARWLPVAIAIAITVILDQWTKQLAIEHLQGQPDQFYLNDILRFTFVRNTGAFLSLGADFGPVLRTLLLEGFPAILLVALLVYIFRERRLNGWQVVALALIVGGGLSNIVDRLMLGHVVDMLHLKLFGLQTGIFNVADMAIMAGMFIMLPFAFAKDDEEERTEEAAPSDRETTAIQQSAD
ncbi:signal peptidase II [Lewinella sp. 4G2]|uniref:signal peptidase II n=1 Tax=Lewinella sp. 4G2 TaxID=1803372 RepID=UPI0007B46FDA|nr:signal peptidase II [Lewinella sp. 4G2]OAV44870.1 signal peptidase II [Lewinella sp. 4G2]